MLMGGARNDWVGALIIERSRVRAKTPIRRDYAAQQPQPRAAGIERERRAGGKRQSASCPRGRCRRRPSAPTEARQTSENQRDAQADTGAEDLDEGVDISMPRPSDRRLGRAARQQHRDRTAEHVL